MAATAATTIPRHSSGSHTGGHGRAEPSPSLVLPDLFVSFLAQRPELNPHYERIKSESEAWIKNECNYGPKEYQKHIRADFAYFVAVFAREAGPSEFRTMCDWCNWVFDFDDAFDNGSLKDEPVAAKAAVDELLSTMKKSKPDPCDRRGSALLEIYRSVWYRIAKEAQPGAKRRFVRYMTDYCHGVLNQVNNDAQAITPDTESYLSYRRDSIGISPCFAMIEYFHGLDLPDCVLADPSLQEMEKITLELIILQNDVLSYPKEAAEAFPHNLVSLLGRTQGLTPQQAYHQIDLLLRDRYRRWYLAQAELPQWREEIAVQVQKYLLGCQRLVQANLNWSFRSERYFGKHNDFVRRTRIVPSGWESGERPRNSSEFQQ